MNSSVTNVIKTRAGIRKYQDRPVENDLIRQILAAAMYAPSACNQQPWEFYVVTDKKMIDKLAKASPYAGCAAGAPVVIILAYRENVTAPEYCQIDMALCAENMWLEAETLGLGTVFLGIAPDEERMKAVAEAAGIPASIKPFALFPLGYPNEKPVKESRVNFERIHYITDDDLDD